MKYRDSMDQDFILKIFQSTGALLNGHFKLSSGFHSDTYLQCAKVSQYPEYNSMISTLIAEQFIKDKIDVVIGPALGGIVLAYGIAQKLNCRGIFTERVPVDDKKIMTFRRGFEVKKNERVLVVEDVITTGGSVKEVMEILNIIGADIVGVAGIVDRTNGKMKLHKKQFFTLKLDVQKFSPKDCPLCKKDIPLESPGSKFI